MSLISGANILVARDWLFWRDVLTNYMSHTCPLESEVDHGRQPNYLSYIYIFILWPDVAPDRVLSIELFDI